MLTVIIVNYNAGNLLADCLETVLLSPVVEQVIVVDNASTDDSLIKARQQFSSDQRLLLLENRRNLGFSRANNIALEQVLSESRYLLFLNPDCQLSEGVAERLLVFMENNQDVGMATCLVTNPDGSEQRGCRRLIPTPGNTLGDLFSRWRPSSKFSFNLSESPLPIEPVEVEAISGSFMFARRAVIEEIGSFDEGYFLHCEDLDLCKRISLSGWKIFFIPDVKIIHYQGSCSQTMPLRISWYKHCGMGRFYHKFHRRRYGLPLYLLVTTAIWIHFALGVPKYLLTGRFQAESQRANDRGSL
ncbi:MAG: glycosyltransferase family 2 protein [Pseudomonadota bacterium]|nr:glycosyltransferase family 2 protein [Pseudomonadota bacterium]